MINKLKNLSLTQFAIGLAVLTVVVRLLTLGIYPLMDTTEARYGEMARIMSETGNWITPMFDYNVPFWGKPPLFSWLSAAGFELIGVNEFAARVPHMMVGIIILWLTWTLVNRSRQNRDEAWLATAVLASSTVFIVNSGAVMTDTALTLGITLSMAGFWLSWQHHSKLWGYLFFVGLAIGMLAKGPLTLVLVGISLFIWLAQDGRWKRTLSCLPWKGGILLFLLISLPWYLIAEWKSPGFLNYFIVGEHIKRFIVSGWEGDLYGTAHREVRGTIWLYGIIAALPWTPVLFVQVWRLFRSGEEGVQNDSGYRGFLWCWMLSPLLLFTLAGNILPSYVMPGLPAFALLIASYQTQRKLPEWVYKIGLITPVLLVIAALFLSINLSDRKTEKALMTQWKNQPEASQSELVYLHKRPFSAQYYSKGKAKELTMSLDGLLTQRHIPMFLVVEKRYLSESFIWEEEQCELRGESKRRVMAYCGGLN